MFFLGSAETSYFENLFEHSFATDDTFKVWASQNIRIFLSDTPTTFAGNMVEVLAGINQKVNVNDFGVDLETHKYLIVVNLSTTEVVNFKVSLL